MSPEPLVPHIFMADDSVSDCLLLRLAFTEAKQTVQITQATDGAIALDQLSHAATLSPLPYQLILIDLGLPKLNGLELLDRILEHPGFSSTPIVVLTSSTNPKDRRSALRLQAAAFLTKPDDYPGVRELVKELSRYIFPSDDGRSLV